jgi:SAM-dependent MidA family methyltransferase
MKVVRDLLQKAKNNDEDPKIQTKVTTSFAFNSELESGTTANGTPIRWYNNLQEIPLNKGPILFVTNELFDALPVHQFKRLDGSWREKLIDVDLESETQNFRWILSPSSTLPSRVASQ